MEKEFPLGSTYSAGIMKGSLQVKFDSLLTVLAGIVSGERFVALETATASPLFTNKVINAVTGITKRIIISFK